MVAEIMTAENRHEGAAAAGGPEGGARNAGLRRKLGVVRPPEAGAMTPARALALALPKVADEGFALPAVMRGIEEVRRLAPAALLEWLAAFARRGGGEGAGGAEGEGPPAEDGAPEDPASDAAADPGAGASGGASGEAAPAGLSPLILALEREDGLRAYALPDPQFVAALIEVQTLGTVLPRPAEPRPPTITDGAMCAPFIEGVLERFERALASQTLPYWAGGYFVGAQVRSLRHLEMMLEDIPYRLYALEADLGDGAKLGRIVLVFPDVAAPPETRRGEGPGWQALFTGQVLRSRARLEAVLRRIEMPLAEVRRLKVGDVLKMPMNVIGEVELVEPSGRLLARCRLGQKGGQKALRLRAPGAEAPDGGAHPEEGQGFSAGSAGAAGAPQGDAGAMGLDMLAGEGAPLPGGPPPGGALPGGVLPAEPPPGGALAGGALAGGALPGGAGPGEGGLPDPPPAPVSMAMGGDLPPSEAPVAPAASLGGDVPASAGLAEGGGDLPPPGDLPPLGEPLGDLPPLGEQGAAENPLPPSDAGDLPLPGDLPAGG